MTQQSEIPRTDICEDCEREIVSELVGLEGQHEIIHDARKADERFMPITAGTATVQFQCRCSNMKVEYGPGSADAWDVPDGWLWEDDVDDE